MGSETFPLQGGFFKGLTPKHLGLLGQNGLSTSVILSVPVLKKNWEKFGVSWDKKWDK